MDNIAYTWWLLNQAAGGLFYLWPVTFVLIIWLVIALVTTRNHALRISRGGVGLMLAPTIGTIVTLLSGVVFERQTQFIVFPHIGFILVVTLSAFSIYRMRHQWQVPIAAAALALWVSFFAWFVSIMSVSGDWM